MNRRQISFLLIISMLFHISISMQLTLIHPATCLQFAVQQTQTPLLFSYHFNPHIDSVNMLIYNKQTQIINQTGSGIDYHTFLQIQFNQTGTYPICFEKLSSKNADIQFDIITQEDKMYTAGKQDINKLSRKISQFLVDIKKTGWEFKQILEQNNKITDKLRSNQNQNYFIFATKMSIMAIILAIQFYAVKYFFN